MIRDLVAGLLFGLLDWLRSTFEAGHRAADAPSDPGRLRRAGGRLRAWLRSHGARARIESVQDRTRDASSDLHDD